MISGFVAPMFGPNGSAHELHWKSVYVAVCCELPSSSAVTIWKLSSDAPSTEQPAPVPVLHALQSTSVFVLQSVAQFVANVPVGVSRNLPNANTMSPPYAL